MKRLICVLMVIILPVGGWAQGYIKSDYLFSSTLKDEKENKYGSGSLTKISGRYTLPLSVKRNEQGKVTAWSATLSGTYAILDNQGVAADINPSEVLNANLSVAHMRPLSGKWSLIASLGGGIFSEPDQVTTKSLLASGALIFVYRINQKLDAGIGVGLTNSYGVPIIMPMTYFKVNFTGKYEIKADISSRMEVSAAVMFGNKFRLKLVAMEMDGISAVMERDGRSMIYSSTMMRSYLTPEWQITPKSTLFLGAGGGWMRSVQLSERTLKGFWNNFKNDDGEFQFKSTGYLTVGFRYGF